MERFDNLLDTSKAIDTEESYCEMLRECESNSLTGIFAGYDPADVLKEIDPTAYRCGCNDYIDSQDWTEYNGETYETSYLEEIREQVESEIEDEIEVLENQLVELGSGMVERLDAITDQINVLNNEIQALYRLF